MESVSEIDLPIPFVLVLVQMYRFTREVVRDIVSQIIRPVYKFCIGAYGKEGGIVSLDTVSICVMLFVDDIVLAADSQECLEKLLDILGG